jgi:hypothetical protein
MKKYRVMLNSTNMLLRDADDGTLTKHGFYAHRYLEANDEVQAEERAVKMIIEEYKDYVKNERDDPPVVYVESIEEIEISEGSEYPNRGATWYVEE